MSATDGMCFNQASVYSDLYFRIFAWLKHDLLSWFDFIGKKPKGVEHGFMSSSLRILKVHARVYTHLLATCVHVRLGLHCDTDMRVVVYKRFCPMYLFTWLWCVLFSRNRILNAIDV